MVNLTDGLEQEKAFLSHAPGYWAANGGVAPELWNDWKWQLQNRVTKLGQLEEHLSLSEEERAGVLLSGDKLALAITPALFQSDPARKSGRSDPASDDSANRGNVGFALRHGGPMRGRLAHAGAGVGPPISGSRAIFGDGPLCRLLPLLHAQPCRQRGGGTGIAY